MGGDWTRYCHVKDFAVEGDRVRVTFADGRGHDVSVQDEADAYRLSAIVVDRRVAGQVPDLRVRAWECNRVTELAGFQLDARGRLRGACWVPKVGLTAEEFRIYVRTLARECDNYEYRLTGKDKA
jgi:hypothetical protein